MVGQNVVAGTLVKGQSPGGWEAMLTPAIPFGVAESPPRLPWVHPRSINSLVILSPQRWTVSELAAPS